MILVVATLPNRTPDSWYANRRKGLPGYPRNKAWDRGWSNAPSGGKGPAVSFVPTYKTKGVGSG